MSPASTCSTTTRRTSTAAPVPSSVDGVRGQEDLVPPLYSAVASAAGATDADEKELVMVGVTSVVAVVSTGDDTPRSSVDSCVQDAEERLDADVVAAPDAQQVEVAHLSASVRAGKVSAPRADHIAAATELSPRITESIEVQLG